MAELLNGTLRLLIRSDGTRAVASAGDEKFLKADVADVRRELTPFEAYRKICKKLDASVVEPPEDVGHPVDPEVGYRVLELLESLWDSGFRRLGVLGTVGCGAPLHDIEVGNPVGWTSVRVSNPGSDLDLVAPHRDYLFEMLLSGFETVKRFADRVIMSPAAFTGFTVPRVEVRLPRGC
ncbi:hypothetical protein [Methanopyrus kandleri]